MQQHYIVVPPEQFTMRQSINPLSVPARNPVNHKKAATDFNRLVRILHHLGVNPISVSPALLDPHNTTPDILYTANWGLSLPLPTAPFILSRMKTPYRRPESSKIAGYLLSHLRTNLYELPPSTIFEGTGLACWSHNMRHLWIAHGVRTSYRDAVALKRTVTSIYRAHNRQPPFIHILHIRNPWYDLDLSFLTFPNGKLLYRPDAFMPESVRKLREVFGTDCVEFRATNSPFALNAKIINGHVLCGTVTEEAKQIIRRVSSLPVISCPLSYAEQGGGSLRCCVLDFFSRSS